MRLFGNVSGNKIVITAAGNNGGLDRLLQEPWPVKKSPARGGVSVIGSVREEVRAVVLVIAKRTLLAAMDTPESGHSGRDLWLSY